MKAITLSVISAVILSCVPIACGAQTLEKIKYGDFNSWITRNIKESRVLGGNVKKVYAIGPTATMGSVPYQGSTASPWATSNVMARIMGVTKGSNAVYPEEREGHGKCARMCTEIEHCKAAGLVSMDVVVAGTIFLGKMQEPVKSTKNPYSKMEMGVPYTRRPQALVFDYKLVIPGTTRLYSSGFGAKKELPGADKAEALILLQRRWEDEDGNIYAKRVGTGRELIGKSTESWINGHKVAVHYGDAAAVYPLIPVERSYYARNRKGRLMPVHEVGWDSSDAVPTHMIILFSSGSGAPYTGTVGSEFCIDNVALQL
ncbi:MAG: PCMD domain-containing protein [Muribaculaceae bacterium]|nr:PCMD domain-containing protein [Muribaculaceae bacterium]